MPRRKKNGHSPARVLVGPPEGGSLSYNTGNRLYRGFDSAMANNFSSSSSSSSAREKMVQSMQEMFSHLDPEVIDIVLSECDFKAENAMDSLLELSVAAEVAAPIPSPVSGFEQTAAALLDPHHLSESIPDSDLSRLPQLPSVPSSVSPLTEELDLLVDQELEILAKQEEHHSSQWLSSLPPPPFPQQVLPELLQSSLQPGSRGSSHGLVQHITGTSSPLDLLSTLEDRAVEGQQGLIDFTHLMTDTPSDTPKPHFDLASSGRPSAFQVYKKQDLSHTLSDRPGVMPSKEIVGGARSKVQMWNQEPFGYMQSSWNLEAPVFSPSVHANQGLAFITPVAQPPSNWTSQPRHPYHWLSQGAVSQAPLIPFATIPKSWAMASPQTPAEHSRLRLRGKVLVLLRGAPGSGKSTVARALVEHNPGGVRLSSDDFFCRHGDYQFDPSALGEAHEWNHKRVAVTHNIAFDYIAKEAFQMGTNPIIIDNTNMQGWEMRPYVVQAIKHGYKVLFREPDTWWKNKPRELERRTSHNVPMETIRRMLYGFERYVTVQSIMGSQMPESKKCLPLDDGSPLTVSSEAPCPDLIGQPKSTEECTKLRPQLFASLPDVSSIGRSSETGMLEDDTHKSMDSLNIHPAKRLAENPEMSDGDNDIDLEEFDLELDAQLELSHPAGNQRIPDCIVESVMNEDHCGDELTVAFSESIGQRVRRERPSRMSGFDRLEPSDLVKDTNQSDSEASEKERTTEGEAEGVERWSGEEKGMLKELDFVVDWPSQGSLEQRQAKSRERHEEGDGKGDELVSQEANENKTNVKSGPAVEFQRLLDLIQTGVMELQTGSSPLSSLSLSSGGEFEIEEEAGSRFEESYGSRSNSDEGDQNSGRGELPDCVLNWKAADSCKVTHSGIDHWKPENKGSCNGGETEDFSRETEPLVLESNIVAIPPTSPIADSLIISKSVEANVNHNEQERCGVEDEVFTEPSTDLNVVDTNKCSEDSRETGLEASVSQVCQSPVCESPVCESSVCEGSVCEGSVCESSVCESSVCESSVCESSVCESSVCESSVCESSVCEGSVCESSVCESSVCEGSVCESSVCESSVCESSVEADSSAFSGGSQERKQRQGRRSGKQCKLALTFTQNCPASSINAPECPIITAQNKNGSITTDVESTLSLNCSFSPEPSPKVFTESKAEAHPQPPSPLPVVDEGCPSQTEPQDFALLWRLNRQESPDEAVAPACSLPCDIVVLSGDSSRFVPEMSAAVSAAVAVNPSCHPEVPYHVVHEKSTQVEEKELETRDRLESLRILSRHFKLVSFDTLEDLYDKCHQDIEWTTNLLLDSGERFFREEDGTKNAMDAAGDEEDRITSSLCGVSGKPVETGLFHDVLDKHDSEHLPPGFEEGSQESTYGTFKGLNESSINADVLSLGGAAGPVNKDLPDTASHVKESPQTEPGPLAVNIGERRTEHKVALEADREGAALGGGFDNRVIIEESRVEIEDIEAIASIDEVHRRLQAELDEIEREEKQREQERTERRHVGERRSLHLDIQSLEMKLPTEVALQLTELFGPVGVDPDSGTCSSDDYTVQMDLNLAKLLHQKWKETFQEKQRQAALSFHLLQESSEHWGETQVAKPGPQDHTQPAPVLISADGYASLDNQPEARSQRPHMNHWNVSQPHISLRNIMKEEQALQENMRKMRHSREDLDQRNGATQLKEKQLYSLFPSIDRHFLQDIFRDHNYNLSQTELFLHSLLNEEPVKTVVAPEAPRSDHHRPASKEREKRQKAPESLSLDYQDTEDPEYDDFRAEASLQRSRQLESFSKATEAFKQGRKEVASFYAQQGHLHGKRMHEANHRAAVQIFRRVNSSLLPNNILDLHGLHVHEALEHLAQVLQDKTSDCEQGLCRPQLSVITGRGNHSHGGVARIRPAVIDYLTRKRYRFTEPKPGLVLVSLK